MRLSELVHHGPDQPETRKTNGSWYGHSMQVRDNLNDVAETWTDEQKEHCLQETTESFKVRRIACTSYAHV